MGKHIPAFLTRLSHIIIIQVLFIFAALALVVFYPADQVVLDSGLTALEGHVHELSEKAGRLIAESPSDVQGGFPQADLRTRLNEMFAGTEDVVYAALYVSAGHDSMINVYQYRPAPPDGNDEIDNATLEYVDRRLSAPSPNIVRDVIEPLGHTSQRSLFSYRFRMHDATPAALVTALRQNLIIASKRELSYALLLVFLASTLVWLLTVHFISRKFKTPLERLSKGFEKTAAGELYYLIETNGDSELSKLAGAFNDMSRTLYENHRELRAYNSRLKAINQRLRESRMFFSTLIDSSPNAVISTLPDGRIRHVNRRACADFGCAPKDVLGKDVKELFANRFASAGDQGGPDDSRDGVEVLCERRDGSVFPAYLITSSVRDREGNVTANMYIIRDISESKSFQEMMVRLDRYYTRGEMAGDIAHEINNFLAVLSGNVELMPLMMKRGDREKIDKKLELMKTTVAKIARFTDGLMDANMGEVRFEPVDINQLVENMIAFLKPQNRFDEITVRTDLATDIPLVELDVGQMQQLLVNLLNNSSDALAGREGERTIVVATSLVHPAPDAVVRLEVKDNGPGVDKDKEGWLFRKRFTTKKHGHGIGLITCRRIVDAHGGSIGYAFNAGAVFTVALSVTRTIASNGDAASDARRSPTVPA